MGKVTIKYRASMFWEYYQNYRQIGDQEEIFDFDVIHINLYDRKIKSIDLGPLVNCTHLEYLSLAKNQIQELDLRLLSGCVSLQNLHLNDNQLQEVDLSPLVSCQYLKNLLLEWNVRVVIDSQYEDTALPKAIEKIRSRVIWMATQET